VNSTTVVAAVESDKSDENHAPLAKNFQQLEAMTDQDGAPLSVVPLPMPRPKYHEGQRLPAGYCNFYIANGVVVVPQFGDPADQVASPSQPSPNSFPIAKFADSTRSTSSGPRLIPASRAGTNPGKEQERGQCQCQTPTQCPRHSADHGSPAERRPHGAGWRTAS
jgi:hypothetical protein